MNFIEEYFRLEILILIELIEHGIFFFKNTVVGILKRLLHFFQTQLCQTFKF